MECPIFIRVKSQLWIYTKYSLSIINLHKPLAYTFVKFKIIAKNWHFCTLFIDNTSVAHPLDPKTFDKRRSGNHRLNLLTSGYLLMDKLCCSKVNHSLNCLTSGKIVVKVSRSLEVGQVSYPVDKNGFSLIDKCQFWP